MFVIAIDFTKEEEEKKKKKKDDLCKVLGRFSFLSSYNFDLKTSFKYPTKLS